MTYPRRLSARVREVLEFLLADADERLAPLRAQAKTGVCDCGCPTIYLEVDKTLAAASLGSPAVQARSREQPAMAPLSHVGLILFLDEGFLSALELWYVSDVPPSGFPSPTTFETPQLTG
jgi:hypothetical protein